MKINDVVKEQRVDELDAGQVGQAIGKGVKAVGTGISNFAKGFKAGWSGQGNAPSAAAGAAPKGAPAGKATTAAKGPLDDIKTAITKLSPKQRAALRKQIAQKAGIK